jgi:hypothetical protein
MYGTATAIALAQSAISIRELPPEPIPRGVCTQSNSGYLGIEEYAKNRFELSNEQIGEYVVARIRQGYSLSLYPQASGRIFAIAQCGSAGTTASH